MSKKCTPLWHEAHLQVKMYKTLGVRTTFGGSDVEKVHAVVAGRTFRSQNVQNTRGSDHFWRFRCRKSVRRCGTKHISKSKCEIKNIRGSDHFWRFRCRFPSLHYTTLHSTTLHSTPLHYTTLHNTTTTRSGAHRWPYGFVHFHLSFDTNVSMVIWQILHAGHSKCMYNFTCP